MLYVSEPGKTVASNGYFQGDGVTFSGGGTQEGLKLTKETGKRKEDEF